MPLYDVEHTTPLSKSQRDALAQAITKIHSETFTTPKLFVNVRFVDLGKRRDEVQYIAGKEKQSVNRIIANVRPSPSRTASMWNDICTQLTAAWTTIVIDASPASSPQTYPLTPSSPPSNRKHSFLSNSSDTTPSSRPNMSSLSEQSKEDKQLRAIFVLGSIIGGMEVGFELPPAGGDREWMRENWGEFERLAGEGDEEMRELVEEVRGRELL